MEKQVLHISNGSSLTKLLLEQNISGDIITWEEMVCEGPTFVDIDNEAFFKTTKSFFASEYQLELEISKFKN